MAAAEGLRRSVKGLSEVEFRERFGTEEACRQALFEMRWREGLTCPRCGGSSFCRLKARRLFQCNWCKKQVGGFWNEEQRLKRSGSERLCQAPRAGPAP